MFHWLVIHGFWNDIIAFFVGYGLSHVVGLRKLKQYIIVHMHQQQRIVNLLDTSKPGGLTDLLPLAGDAGRRDSGSKAAVPNAHGPKPSGHAKV